MAKHNVTQASELVSKNRKTLQRYMKSGKLSYKTRPDGQKEIDTAELIRVFGNTPKLVKLSQHVAPHESRDVASLLGKVERELKEIRRENRELKKDNRRLHEKLDEAINLMITHKQTKPQQRKPIEIELEKKEKQHYSDSPELFDIPTLIPTK